MGTEVFDLFRCISLHTGGVRRMYKYCSQE